MRAELVSEGGCHGRGGREGGLEVGGGRGRVVAGLAVGGDGGRAVVVVVVAASGFGGWVMLAAVKTFFEAVPAFVYEAFEMLSERHYGGGGNGGGGDDDDVDKWWGDVGDESIQDFSEDNANQSMPVAFVESCRLRMLESI